MSDSKLEVYQESIVYGVNPQTHLSMFSDCIVAGNKNLDDITVVIQKEVASAQSEAASFLASVDGAMAAVTAAKEAAKAAAEEAERKKKTF